MTIALILHEVQK